MLDARLVTSGCSFTQYCWPTWADYLGRHYREHMQAGMCAIDNATVARQIIKHAQPGDHVVISWTGMDRWAPFLDDKWVYKGCIAAHKHFFTEYYHRVERFTTSMDYIRMVELHSKAIGYQVWHFTSYPWFQGEIEKNIDPRLVEIFENYNIQNFYIDENLESFCDQSGIIVTHHKYNPHDNHPTPWHHWEWLKKYIAPIIGITLDSSIENSVKYDQERVLKGDVD